MLANDGTMVSFDLDWPRLRPSGRKVTAADIATVRARWQERVRAHFNERTVQERSFHCGYYDPGLPVSDTPILLGPACVGLVGPAPGEGIVWSDVIPIGLEAKRPANSALEQAADSAPVDSPGAAVVTGVGGGDREPAADGGAGGAAGARQSESVGGLRFLPYDAGAGRSAGGEAPCREPEPVPRGSLSCQPEPLKVESVSPCVYAVTIPPHLAGLWPKTGPDFLLVGYESPPGTGVRYIPLLSSGSIDQGCPYLSEGEPGWFPLVWKAGSPFQIGLCLCTCTVVPEGGLMVEYGCQGPVWMQ